jgi:hypothetical protein
MKTKCDNIRWVDTFDVKIELTKEDIGDLLTLGRIFQSIGHSQDKEMKIEIKLAEKDLAKKEIE